MEKEIVVYTAISGDYDELRTPSVINKNADYVCYTDNSRIKSDFWEIREFPKNNLDSVRKARNVKIRPHLYLEGYKFSIWIDGNLDIIGDIDTLMNNFQKQKYKLMTFKHPERNCIYKEAERCIYFQNEDPFIINKQIEAYTEDGLPKEVGMVETNVLLREHNDERVIESMEKWWLEVEKYSRRDQLSFNYVFWKYQYEYGLLMGDSRGNSSFFERREHKTSIAKKIKRKIKRVFHQY